MRHGPVPGSPVPGGAELDFLPSADALPFPNRIPATGFDYPAVPLPVLRRLVVLSAGDGLCGGLVFTALDLFLAHRRPWGDGSPPAADDPLLRHLVARQRAGVLAADRRTPMTIGGRAVVQAQRRGDADAGGDLARSARREWSAVRRDLDAGRPSPLHLVAAPRAAPGRPAALAATLRRSHQVLASGYGQDDAGRVVLRALDPNDLADDDCTLSFDLADGGGLALSAPRIEQRLGHQARFRGFFRAAYRRAPPPAGGRAVSPARPARPRGGSSGACRPARAAR